MWRAFSLDYEVKGSEVEVTARLDLMLSTSLTEHYRKIHIQREIN